MYFIFIYEISEGWCDCLLFCACELVSGGSVQRMTFPTRTTPRRYPVHWGVIKRNFFLSFLFQARSLFYLICFIIHVFYDATGGRLSTRTCLPCCLSAAIPCNKRVCSLSNPQSVEPGDAIIYI